MARILVGIASRAFPTYPKFQESLPLFLADASKEHDLGLRWVVGQPLAEAQNELAQTAVDRNYSHLLTLEDDNWGFTAAILNDLLRSNADMVGVNYHSRWFPYVRCLMTLLPYHMDHYREAPYNDGVHPCDLVPFGMTLIDTRTFSRLPKPWFQHNRPGSYATDKLFCRRLQQHGMTPMGCFDHIIGHRDLTAISAPEKRASKLVDFNRRVRILRNKKGPAFEDACRELRAREQLREGVPEECPT